MWQNGQDTSQDGVPVRLYQPILYSSRKTTNAPTVSHVGGTPTYFDNDALVSKTTPRCTSCKDEMNLLLQLYNPESERTLYVFGCNRGSCVAATFDGDSPFSLGGGGRFVCRHSQAGEAEEDVNTEPASTITVAVESSPWGTNDMNVGDNSSGDDDWDVTNDDDNVDNVEAMVAAMEMNGPVMMKAEKQKPSRTPSSKQSQNGLSSLPCFEIHSLQEPAAIRQNDDGGMDDDDVGILTGGTDDRKIQEMLARYMQQEEDPEILAAIQGSSTNGGGVREKDERLPAEDRAMLAFTDRVKRLPRQIVRYARGGIPLWSVPLPVQPNGSNHKNSSTSVQETPAFSALNVPNCPCGAEREFECQLMPNLLSVLNVDKHARKAQHQSSLNLNINQLMSRDYGGMNWGAIAVYTCKESCDMSRDDFVIVQDSTDGTPEKRMGATDDAMVVDQDEWDGNDKEFDK